jgi:hypothetical protein
MAPLAKNYYTFKMKSAILPNFIRLLTTMSVHQIFFKEADQYEEIYIIILIISYYNYTIGI